MLFCFLMKIIVIYGFEMGVEGANSVEMIMIIFLS